jgi:Zn-dependent peptidase ImmA (M78 family)
MKKNLLNRRIMVCGVWFTITPHKFEEGDWGSCTFNDKSIFISEDLTEDQKLVTIAHELTHAILREKKIDDLLQQYLTTAITKTKADEICDVEDMALDLEEEICEAMETGYKSFKNI